MNMARMRYAATAVSDLQNIRKYWAKDCKNFRYQYDIYLF